MSKLESEVLNAVRGALTLREDQLLADTLIQDVVRDSMDIVELIAVLSSDFGIAVIPRELDKIRTAGDIVHYVERHRKP
jgi:acyl carrier protein